MQQIMHATIVTPRYTMARLVLLANLTKANTLEDSVDILSRVTYFRG